MLELLSLLDRQRQVWTTYRTTPAHVAIEQVDKPSRDQKVCVRWLNKSVEEWQNGKLTRLDILLLAELIEQLLVALIFLGGHEDQVR